MASSSTARRAKRRRRFLTGPLVTALALASGLGALVPVGVTKLDELKLEFPRAPDYGGIPLPPDAPALPQRGMFDDSAQEESALFEPTRPIELSPPDPSEPLLDSPNDPPASRPPAPILYHRLSWEVPRKNSSL